MNQDVLRPEGIQAAHIYDLWTLMLGMCTAVFLAILIAFLIALWRAPRATERTRPDVEAITRPEPKVLMTISVALGLSAVGLIVLIVASVMTDRALAALPLKDGLVIEVTARQWWWDVTYDDPDPSRIFRTANEIHVPVGRPVVVKLRSDDVIHSFWVPNLHGKKDLIPGHTTLIQFRADTAGVYRGQCAEFCGHQHAKMAFHVIAQNEKDYQQWADGQRGPAQEPATDLEKRGREVFLGASCLMCHRIEGTLAQGRTGPDLTHLASRAMIAAGTLDNTRGNLGGWILDPHGVKPGVTMPANQFSAPDLHALLGYLEKLK